jgi:nitrile hydratase accessory protein
MSDTFVDRVAPMTGTAALPRDNGELAFSAPWEGRAVALAVALVDRLGLAWDDFRQQLITAIADDPARAYYESWAVALEHLVVEQGLATPAALDAATPGERAPL